MLNNLLPSVIENNYGKVIYTNFLNQNGEILSDFTTVPISENNYYIVTASNAIIKDMNHIKHYSKKLNLLNIDICDVSNGYNVLALMGPKSKRLLRNLCINNDELNNENFPYVPCGRLISN